MYELDNNVCSSRLQAGPPRNTVDIDILEYFADILFESLPTDQGHPPLELRSSLVTWPSVSTTLCSAIAEVCFACTLLHPNPRARAVNVGTIWPRAVFTYKSSVRSDHVLRGQLRHSMLRAGCYDASGSKFPFS